MSDYFTFDGVQSTTWLARVFPTDSMLKAPARNYNTVIVPGRSGALLMDLKSYDNIAREYDVQIVGDSGLAQFTALRNFLASRSGYRQLTDTFDTGHFYMAAYMEPFDLTADLHSLKRGRGTITFDCKPQRYLTSGTTEITLTTDGTITNPTRFASRPLIKVTTSTADAVTLGVGSTNIVITYSGTITIDCETGRAYNGSTSLDSRISLNTIDFPTLAPGNTGIVLGTGITRVKITPRWWEL